MLDEYETLHDVLRQIAVHDPCSHLRAAAARYLENRDGVTLGTVMALSVRSVYRSKFLSAYGAVIVLEAA